MSKTIKSHPAVLECEAGAASGVDDYKYNIFLKDGWVFSAGHTAGCRTLHCQTVKEFLAAQPVQVQAQPVQPVQQAVKPSAEPSAEPSSTEALSKGQRRRLNKAWRKAGLFGKASTAERKAQAAVDKRCQLADLMTSKDIGQRVAARKEYHRISGEYTKPVQDVKGFWNANAARGRTKAKTIPV